MSATSALHQPAAVTASAETPPPPPASSLDWEALWQESGYSATRDAAGVWTVALDTGGGPHEAVLDPAASDPARLHTLLLRVGEVPPTVAAALSEYARQTRAVLRRVRPRLQPASAGQGLVLESALREGAAAEDLGEVLDSLALACRLFAAPARALLDPELARLYLEVAGSGASADACQLTPNPNPNPERTTP